MTAGEQSKTPVLIFFFLFSADTATKHGSETQTPHTMHAPTNKHLHSAGWRSGNWHRPIINLPFHWCPLGFFLLSLFFIDFLKFYIFLFFIFYFVLFIFNVFIDFFFFIISFSFLPFFPFFLIFLLSVSPQSFPFSFSSEYVFL